MRRGIASGVACALVGVWRLEVPRARSPHGPRAGALPRAVSRRGPPPDVGGEWHPGVREQGEVGVSGCAAGLLLGASVPVCPDVGRASGCLVPNEGPDPLGPCTARRSRASETLCAQNPHVWDASLEEPAGAVAISGQ